MPGASEEGFLALRRPLPDRTLVVLQGEMASALPGQADALASPFATTCHIVILRSPKSGRCAVAHFDNAQTASRDVAGLLALFEDDEREQGLEGHVVGGYDDERGTSAQLSKALCPALERAGVCIRLLFTGAANTSADQRPGRPRLPVVQSAGVELASGEVFPFEAASPELAERTPMYTLRSIRFLSGGQGEAVIHDARRAPEEGVITLEPFEWHRPQWVAQVAGLPQGAEVDQMILENLSTSPAAEHKDFAADMRRSAAYASKNRPGDVFAGGALRLACWRPGAGGRQGPEAQAGSAAGAAA